MLLEVTVRCGYSIQVKRFEIMRAVADMPQTYFEITPAPRHRKARSTSLFMLSKIPTLYSWEFILTLKNDVVAVYCLYLMIVTGNIFPSAVFFQRIKNLMISKMTSRKYFLSGMFLDNTSSNACILCS